MQYITFYTDDGTPVESSIETLEWWNTIAAEAHHNYLIIGLDGCLN